ncbi:hypothetical protein AUJ14_04810 [Candidatus Micrarchaeota archaeon CG1_02_55_22]|nr:MAG: hypothetical protein AUJ14_04810 [Candidatus Micrarchaeota archaeon CG1_02_55_22]
MLSGFFKRLLMSRQLNFTEGDVTIFDMAYTMHPINYHIHLQQALEEKFGEKSHEILYTTGKRTAEEVAAQFADKFKVTGFDSINLWQNIIELSGTAKIMSISPREGGNVTVQAQSTIAKNMLKLKGKQSSATTDYYLQGFLAGVFSKIYSKEITCTETKCILAGDPYCEFNLSPKK